MRARIYVKHNNEPPAPKSVTENTENEGRPTRERHFCFTDSPEPPKKSRRLARERHFGSAESAEPTTGTASRHGAPRPTRTGMRPRAARGPQGAAPAARRRRAANSLRDSQKFAPRSNGSAGGPKSGHRARTPRPFNFSMMGGSRRYYS